MKIGWYLIGGVAAYLAYKAYQVNKAISTFQYSVKSIRYNANSSNLLQTVLSVTLNINNVTQQPISFQSFTGSLKVKNIAVANFNIGNNNGISIHPGSNEISFPVTVNHLNLATDIKSLLNTWKATSDESIISIDGVLTAAGVSLPLSQSLLLNQPSAINGVTVNEKAMFENTVFKFSHY